MRLFLLGMEHECATRVPDKPLRPFGDVTLFDLLLSKFRALEDRVEFCGQGIALWEGDERLCLKAQDAGVPIIPRSEASAKGSGDYREVFSYLKGIDADHVLRVSTCAPFLQAATLLRMAREYHCETDAHRDRALMVPIGAWLFEAPRDDHMVYIGQREKTSQTMNGTWKCTHGAFIFSPHTMLRDGWCWRSDIVARSMVTKPMEALDIDTETDFRIASVLYRDLSVEERRELTCLA